MNSRIPEDSVLRRHHVASALGDILAAMPDRPSDSVLRRHFDSAVANALVAAVGTEAAALLLGGRTTSDGAPAPAALASASAVKAAPAPPAAQPSPSGGGFFGWLKRLLGG